ncbi:MAG: 30S ribosomal protein S6 [Bernardetiaceae bacterium]|nr:30S ribosomal protein S6 [Bernardetiaceae bacterium]
MRNYETIFVLTPVLSETQLQEISDKFKNLLLENGADVYHTENWGLRKLAYPIARKTTGYYFLFEFKADPELISRLEIEYRRDDRLLRFLTVALDRDALAYSEKRRGGAFKKKKEATDETAAAQ